MKAFFANKSCENVLNVLYEMRPTPYYEIPAFNPQEFLTSSFALRLM